MTKPFNLADLQKMAQGLIKDPAIKKKLKAHYRRTLHGEHGNKIDQAELSKLYEHIKKEFEHDDTPVGDEDEK